MPDESFVNRRRRMNLRAEFPALEPDLVIVRDVLDPPLMQADAVAMRYHRRFRRSELTLILGAVVAIVLGAIAAALSGNAEISAAKPWAISEGLLTLFLGAFAFVVRSLHWHDRWRRQRTVAESLRGEQFLFLGRVGGYAKAQDARRSLEERVVEIERQGVETNV